MRGALPDAECPRCGERFPPSAERALVTCARCGLAFVPHEIEHRLRRPPVASPGEQPDPAPLVRPLPPGVLVARGPLRITVTQRPVQILLAGGLGAAAVFAPTLPWLLLPCAAALLLGWADRVVTEVTADGVTVRHTWLPGTTRRLARADVLGLRVAPRGVRCDVVVDLANGRQLRLARSLGPGAARDLARWFAERLDLQRAP